MPRRGRQRGSSPGLVSRMRFGSLSLIIIGTQLNGNAKYLGPALVFTLLDFLLSLVLAIEIGRKTSRVENQPSRALPWPAHADTQ
jgi:hypothetical protein